MKHFSLNKIIPFFAAITLAGCGGAGSSSGDDNASQQDGSQASDFNLTFKALSGVEEINCDTMLYGFGPAADTAVGISDLRFYVSNIRLFNVQGEEVELTLDSNEFQYQNDQGFVGLIDLTSNSTGSCASDAIAFSEGTARTNNQLTGKVTDSNITRITFDLGVPQALMKDVIATNSAEDAPSPLNEMYWSWASGYRHFVMNFSIEDVNGTPGEGYLHIGSRGCGGDGILALEGKEQCDLVNTPSVELTSFDPAVDAVVINIQQLLANLNFTANKGGAPTVSCHSASSDTQPDCGPVFDNFGLNGDDGTADSGGNKVVGVE